MRRPAWLLEPRRNREPDGIPRYSSHHWATRGGRYPCAPVLHPHVFAETVLQVSGPVSDVTLSPRWPSHRPRALLPILNKGMPLLENLATVRSHESGRVTAVPAYGRCVANMLALAPGSSDFHAAMVVRTMLVRSPLRLTPLGARDGPERVCVAREAMDPVCLDFPPPNPEIDPFPYRLVLASATLYDQARDPGHLCSSLRKGRVPYGSCPVQRRRSIVSRKISPSFPVG